MQSFNGQVLDKDTVKMVAEAFEVEVLDKEAAGVNSMARKTVDYLEARPSQTCCVVLVLSCLVLSCLVLSCLVLSCLVLSCLVLSCLVLCYITFTLYHVMLYSVYVMLCLLNL